MKNARLIKRNPLAEESMRDEIKALTEPKASS